jgi:hypothetical protein
MVTIRWVKKLPAMMEDEEGGWAIMTGTSKRAPFAASKETAAHRRPRGVNGNVGKKHTVAEALSQTGNLSNII